MKRLALIVIIAALCILPVTASAGDNGWKNFQGTYEMIASGNCIHSLNGFNETTLKANPGVVYAGTTAWIGTWKFNKDGTGTYSDKFYATVTPPPLAETVAAGVSPVIGGIRTFEDNDVPFTFTVNAFGDITINEIPTTSNGYPVEYTGSISTDKKQMHLIDTPRIKGPFGYPFWSLICSTARTLMKVSE